MPVKIKNKLSGRAGESLAEVLIAMLLSALGILLLATMIQSSTAMIASSRSYYQDYIGALNELEAQSGDGIASHIRIEMDGDLLKLTDECEKEVPVVCYAKAMKNGGAVVSYRVNDDAS